MVHRCINMSFMLSLFLAATAAAQEDRAAYAQRLQAGREAAYTKFLLTAPVAPVMVAPPPTGASLAMAGTRSYVAGAGEGIHMDSSRSVLAARVPVMQRTYVHRQPSYLYGFGDLRYNFYDNLNNLRGGRYADYPIGPYVFQPLWDSRYRRSWPRPMVVRDYVRSHWLWDGQRYTFVPGHARYETRWITQGRPRYHWNGSHYSVSVSFR